MLPHAPRNYVSSDITSPEAHQSGAGSGSASGSGSGVGTGAGAATGPGTKHARKCKHCSKTFVKTEHLRRHERTHEKLKPFQCETCGKCFGRQDSLQRHQRSHDYTPSYNQMAVDTIAPQYQISETSPSLVSQTFSTSDQTMSHKTTSPITPYSTQIGDSYQGNSVNHMSINNITGSGYSLETRSFQQQQPPNWDIQQMEAHAPLWRVGEEFDLQTLNTWMNGDFTSPLPMPNDIPWSVHYANNVEQTTHINEQLQSSVSRAVVEPFQQEAQPTVSEIWFNKLTEKNTAAGGVVDTPMRPATPPIPQPTNNLGGTSEVEDVHRMRFTTQMPRWPEMPLPSAEFLNLCIQLYFSRFNDIFPLIHRPTFRPSQKNSFLILCICSIGSLFIGSDFGRVQGIKIFERLNKVVLASWERLMAKRTEERLAMVQAAVIAQTFALLSGVPHHLAIGEAFHGLVVYWARSAKLFEPSQNQVDLEELGRLSDEDLNQEWGKWARKEEMDRVTLGLTIHDAELSSLNHHQPQLRPEANVLSISFPAKVYNATDAREWLRLMHDHNAPRRYFRDLQRSLSRGEVLAPPELSMHAVYIAIVEIASKAAEERGFGTLYTSESNIRFTNLLLTWYRSYQAVFAADQRDPFCLIIYFHAVFIYISVDFNRLESAVGRDRSPDGHDSDDENIEYVKEWASSRAARRAIVHAFFLQKELGARRLDQEPGIHVPRAVFQAAVALYCYTQFGPDGDVHSRASPSSSSTDEEAQNQAEFPEARLLGFKSAEVIFEINGFRKQRPAPLKSVTLCALYDLLQRIGHWEIARSFAKIVGLLIHGDSEL